MASVLSSRQQHQSSKCCFLYKSHWLCAHSETMPPGGGKVLEPTRGGIKNLKLDFRWNVKLEWSSFHFSPPTIRLGHRGQIQRQACLAEEQSGWMDAGLRCKLPSGPCGAVGSILTSAVWCTDYILCFHAIYSSRGFFQEGESCTVCYNRDTVWMYRIPDSGVTILFYLERFLGVCCFFRGAF